MRPGGIPALGVLRDRRQDRRKGVSSAHPIHGRGSRSMSPELIAILGVGVALAALMFHILRRMEERLRQDMQRSEERARHDIRGAEERTRQEARESEERMRQDIQGAEERTESRFTSLDGRFTSPRWAVHGPGDAPFGYRGAAGEGRRAPRRPPRHDHRPPSRLKTSPAPSGQDAHHAAHAPRTGRCPVEMPVAPTGAALPSCRSRREEAVREPRIRERRRNAARCDRAAFLRSASSVTDARTCARAYHPLTRFMEEGAEACRPS